MHQYTDKKCKRKENWQMNRKYYFNNMWWGWVTGGIYAVYVMGL